MDLNVQPHYVTWLCIKFNAWMEYIGIYFLLETNGIDFDLYKLGTSFLRLRLPWIDVATCNMKGFFVREKMGPLDILKFFGVYGSAPSIGPEGVRPTDCDFGPPHS